MLPSGLAAALLVLSVGAFAKDDPKGPIAQENKFFRCELPAGWRGRALEGGGPGYFYSEGAASVRAARLDLQAKARQAQLSAGRPEAKASSATVLGRPAASYSRLFQARDSEGRGRPEWIYEQTVIVPAKSGSWELTFRSGAPTRREKPAGEEAWRRFLKTFKPL